MSLYGVFNSTTFNAIEVDNAYTIVTENSAENTLNTHENVGIKILTSNVCSIAQDVLQRVSIAANTCVTIRQNTKNQLTSFNACTISQNVLNLSALPGFFTRNNYIVQVIIGNRVIPNELIFGDIVVLKEEGQNNQATLGLLVQDPVDFIDLIWGKTITIDYVTTTYSQRLFTGVVAIPEIDLINKNVKLTCYNNRDELINNTLTYKLPTTGRYSFEVQGEVTDTASEMKLRLNTITQSLDFDGYNTPRFTSWFAKATADYTLTASDVFYRQPKVIWQDRTKIKNNYNISLSYQYTRLYHYERSFNWTFPYEFCEFLHYQYSLPTIQMITDAINSANWKIIGSATFTDVFPPGTCSFGSFVVAWNTTSFADQGIYSQKLDVSGNNVKDANGNNLYNYTADQNQTNLSEIYTIAAEWSAAIRFSQYIQENYTLNVKSSQSISQFSTVSVNEHYNLKDDFDDSEWEKFSTVTAAPADAVVFGTNCYYYNQDTNPELMTNAILTAIDEAKTNIYATHRNTFVIAETSLKPYIDLHHTVKFDSSLITAKGKVQKIVHTIAVKEGKQSSTEITLALFRSVGSATETITYAPARPSDSVTIADETITLPSYYGIENTTLAGYLGNKFNDSTGNPLSLVGSRTDVTEVFRVDTPAIPDSYRKLKELTVAEVVFDINIPNDLLTVVF